LKITSLAIGLLSIISIIPAAQASTTIFNASVIEQPAGNIHAQININIGSPSPLPFEQSVPTVLSSPWDGPSRPEGFGRSEQPDSPGFGQFGGQVLGQPSGQIMGQPSGQPGGQPGGPGRRP
jgi:hypothetical protein